MRTDFSDYKFRAHMVGKILQGLPRPLTENQKETYIAYKSRRNGDGKPLTDNQTVVWAELHSKANAKPLLTDGVKKLLNEIVFFEMFGRRKKIDSKHLKKGIWREEDAITLFSNVTGRLYLKNKERRSNDYFSGECDINSSSNTIDDIKTSWSLDTFPSVSEDLTSSDYRPQGMVYCDIWGKEKYRVAYCLVDTPLLLLERELRSLYYQVGAFDANGDIYIGSEHVDEVKDVIYNHLFTRAGLEEFVHSQHCLDLGWFDDFIEIPESFRVKVFEFDRNEEEVSAMKEMVKIARLYMTDFANELSSNGLVTKSI